MSQTKSQLINPIDGNLNVTGIITANNVIVGAAQTSLVVQGNARITGILTVGTASITFDGNSDKVTIGTGVTIQSGVVSATSYFASSNRRVVALTPGDTTLWYQAAAPVGWTKSTSHNNKALRVVSGTGGGSGGSTGFTSVFTSRTPGGSVSGSNSGGGISSTTLTTAQIPNHTHDVTVSTATGSGGRAVFQVAPGNSATAGNVNNAAVSTGGGEAHGHGFTNPSWSGSFTGSSMDFNVQYIDMIVCSID